MKYMKREECLTITLAGGGQTLKIFRDDFDTDFCFVLETNGIIGVNSKFSGLIKIDNLEETDMCAEMIEEIRQWVKEIEY